MGYKRLWCHPSVRFGCCFRRGKACRSGTCNCSARHWYCLPGCFGQYQIKRIKSWSGIWAQKGAIWTSPEGYLCEWFAIILWAAAKVLQANFRTNVSRATILIQKTGMTLNHHSYFCCGRCQTPFSPVLSLRATRLERLMTVPTVQKPQYTCLWFWVSDLVVLETGNGWHQSHSLCCGNVHLPLHLLNSVPCYQFVHGLKVFKSHKVKECFRNVLVLLGWYTEER